jgi:F-type H+-transporting ATPase subunit b
VNAAPAVPGIAQGIAAAGPFQMLFVQLLAFVILAWILWKFVKPALGKILDDRSRSIEETFRKIEQETAEAARRTAELKESLARIEEEARKRMDASEAEARRARDQVFAESREGVQAAMDKARREIQIEHEKAIMELREQAARLTLGATERLVESAMNDALHERLVENTLARLDAMKKP